MNYAPLLLSRPPVLDSKIHLAIEDSCPMFSRPLARLSSVLALSLHLAVEVQWREMLLAFVPRLGSSHRSACRSSFPCQCEVTVVSWKLLIFMRLLARLELQYEAINASRTRSPAARLDVVCEGLGWLGVGKSDPTDVNSSGRNETLFPPPSSHYLACKPM